MPENNYRRSLPKVNFEDFGELDYNRLLEWIFGGYQVCPDGMQCEHEQDSEHGTWDEFPIAPHGKDELDIMLDKLQMRFPREHWVLMLRLRKPKITAAEIGRMANLSRNRILQMQEKALKVIRHPSFRDRRIPREFVNSLR